MAPLEDALRFGGLALAHAAWIASDLEDGELICPIVIYEQEGSREVYPCEALTQIEAVEIGNRKTEELSQANVDRWAFLREGLVSDSEIGRKHDVLNVSCWSSGLDEPINLVQFFLPNAQGSFRLIGEPVIVLHEHPLNESAQAKLRQFVYMGIDSHPQCERWSEWRSG